MSTTPVSISSVQKRLPAAQILPHKRYEKGDVKWILTGLIIVFLVVAVLAFILPFFSIIPVIGTMVFCYSISIICTIIVCLLISGMVDTVQNQKKIRNEETSSQLQERVIEGIVVASTQEIKEKPDKNDHIISQEYKDSVKTVSEREGAPFLERRQFQGILNKSEPWMAEKLKPSIYQSLAVLDDSCELFFYIHWSSSNKDNKEINEHLKFLENYCKAAYRLVKNEPFNLQNARIIFNILCSLRTKVEIAPPEYRTIIKEDRGIKEWICSLYENAKLSLAKALVSAGS